MQSVVAFTKETKIKYICAETEVLIIGLPPQNLARVQQGQVKHFQLRLGKCINSITGRISYL